MEKCPNTNTWLLFVILLVHTFSPKLPKLLSKKKNDPHFVGRDINLNELKRTENIPDFNKIYSYFKKVLMFS